MFIKKMFGAIYIFDGPRTVAVDPETLELKGDGVGVIDDNWLEKARQAVTEFQEGH